MNVEYVVHVVPRRARAVHDEVADAALEVGRLHARGGHLRQRVDCKQAPRYVDSHVLSP